MFRICNPMSVPPGSADSTTVRPSLRRRLAKRRIWVVLPHPSIPSKVMNMPRSAMPETIVSGNQLSANHETLWGGTHVVERITSHQRQRGCGGRSEGMGIGGRDDMPVRHAV